MTMTAHNREIFDVCDRGEFALLALSTLKELLRHAIASGEDMRAYTDGLSFLFDPHIAAIEESNLALRQHVEEARRVSESGAADSERVHGLRRQLIAGAVSDGAKSSEIASALNMRKTTVESVIRQLQGAGEGPHDNRMAG